MFTQWSEAQPRSSLVDVQASDDDPHDPIEAEVQRILGDLEQAPAEVQTAVLARLLIGFAAKLPSNLPSKVIAAARETSSSKKASGSKGRSSKRSQTEDLARIDSQLALLADPADPIEAWDHFGRSTNTLRQVLSQEPIGALDAMLRHNNMLPGPKIRGKSRAALVENIVQRLGSRFDGPR